MANPEHLARLKQGVEAWNRWRKDNRAVLPDLREANLKGADLSRANLSEANLDGAGLSGATLSEANVSGASISGSNLEAANLCGASLFSSDLSQVNLRAADLSRADVGGADLSGARLDGANLTGAKIGYTTFADVDLSGVIGLEAVRHDAPSSIGVDTIYRSKGKIPHIFLRGAGVPENFIKHMNSLVGTGIEFYSLFISYSTLDQQFTDRLYADLQVNGVRCWFAPHDMRSGKKIHEQIDEAIRAHDKLLLVLSPASMASEWVQTEISKARKRESAERRRILFPIRLCPFETLRDWECFDADAGKDSAREIREYFIPDFSNWNDNEAYRLAFEKLLSDLHGKSDSAFA
jgi:uncharacterized protein YjbI with pentapeptide repeats